MQVDGRTGLVKAHIDTDRESQSVKQNQGSKGAGRKPVLNDESDRSQALA